MSYNYTVGIIIVDREVPHLTMQFELIPPPNLAPPSVRHLPIDKQIELWAGLADESEPLSLAGLPEKIGPDGDLNTAYRDWYARHMDDHERTQTTFLENLS